MGKTTESRHIIRLKQIKMIVQIQKDACYHQKLLASLNNKNHPINLLCTTQAIKRLQLFLKKQLRKQIMILTNYFNSQNQEGINLQNKMINQESNISNKTQILQKERQKEQEKQRYKQRQKQKQECDCRLIKLLEILKLLYKNDDFYQDEDTNLSIYNQLITISDNFEVITKIISLLLNTSFQKIEKQFFYYIYFLCNHLDLYNIKNSSIKDLYSLGKQYKQFIFSFIDQNQQKQIRIENFYHFLLENSLNNSNYIQVSRRICSKFNVNLENNSMTHLALLFKIKMYLKAVSFNSEEGLISNSNSIVQAVSYANAMYCYIEYLVIGQQMAEQWSIPNIFSFPPAYSDIFKQLLQIFLLQQSSKKTHLVIMSSINQILQIQQKTSAVDIVGRLNDNNSLIYKYLSFAKNHLIQEQSSVFSSSLSKQSINLQAISENQFILELFKIMTTQVQQTNELNNIACTIVEKIFKKETICNYNNQVINEAGNLLVSVEYQEQKIMKIIIQKIEKQPSQGKPYLKVLNDLFSKKYQRIIQRRDLAYIARESSQSCILVKVEDLIKQEILKGSVERNSFLMQTVQLIGNICQQSPTLLETIQKTNPNIIPFLFSLAEQGTHIPADIQSITDTINFMHHVSLIDGPIRNTMLKRPLVSFITKILTMNKFAECLIRHNKSVGGYIVGTINRFITNIKICSRYIFNGFINAAILLNLEYQRCSLSKLNQLQTDLPNFQSNKNDTVQVQGETIIQILLCDAKLINLLKMVEKTSSIILKKFNSRSLYTFLKPLLQISLERDNVFLDCSLEHSLLKLVINETMTRIKSYNQTMTLREQQEKQKQNSSNQRNIHILPAQSSPQNRIIQEQRPSQNSSNHPLQVNPNSADQEVEVNQRLVTQNSEQSEVNNNLALNNVSMNESQNVPLVEPANNPIPAQNDEHEQQGAQNDAINLFIQDNIPSAQQDISDYEQIIEENKQSSRMRSQEQQQQNDLFSQQKKYFNELTWKKTKQLTQKYENMNQTIIQYFYASFQKLDNLILPILNSQTFQHQKSIKDQVIKQMAENSIMDEIQRQCIASWFQSELNPVFFTFNSLNILINIQSSKLQRLFKFLQLTLNFDHPEFNIPEYQFVLSKFNQYIIFYLELVSETNAKNISTFIQNQQIKYLDTGKLPKSRVQTKTMDTQNLRKNLQTELNEKWTLYNVLFDSFLRLVSGNLSNLSNRAFFKNQSGFNHFKFIISTILENIQTYIVETIIPLLKIDISVKQFQQFRQAIKILMQIFALNDLRTMEKVKTQSNLLITFYLYQFDPSKQNIFSVLSKLAVQQERFNQQEQQFYKDTKQNRWKYIKKVFLKMTFYKIKYFVSQGFLQEIESIEIQENQPSHKDYQKQTKKNYFIFSRIHQMICIFIENTYFCQNKNGYIRDFLLYSSSLFGLYCNRIRNHKDTIFYNYLFEDNKEKQLTEDQFYYQVNARNALLLTKILQNLRQSNIIYMPMVLKGIFDIQRPKQEKLLTNFNQQMKNLFYEVNRKVDEFHFTLTGKHLCLGFQVPHKKFITALQRNRSNNSSINESLIVEQLDQQRQMNLKLQVLQLNNLLSLIIEFVKYFKSYKCFQQGHAKISANYVKSIVQFGSFLLANFQVEKHFPEEGDSLVLAMIRFVEQFHLYKKEKEIFKKNNKNQKKKSNISKNKKKIKLFNKEGKQNDKQSVSNASQMEEISQNAPSKCSKKSDNKIQKLQKKRKGKLSKNLIKTQKQSLLKVKKEKKTQREKKNSSKELPQISLQQQIEPKGSVLNRVVTDFIKISLTASHQQAYLYSRTAQLIINFIQNFSKDVIIRTQNEINSLKNGKISKADKNKFFIFGSEIFTDLFKIKIKNQKPQGFFYLITYLAMKLMTQIHVKIDIQCAIKRFFYEQQQKAESLPFSCTAKDRNRIKMSQFQGYLVQDSLIDFPDLSYLLSIIKEVKKPNIIKQSKPKPFRKRDQDYIEQIHQFNKKNFKKFQNQSDQVMYVTLKNPQQLDLINLPSIKRIKPSKTQNDQKKVKFYEYRPEGDFAALISQIINNILKIIINQVAQSLQGRNKMSTKFSSEEEKEPQIAFNLKILLYTLQVLCRQSPTIVPWISRFKCKRILISSLKNYNIVQNSQSYKKIVSYIYGNSSLQTQNFQEVSFLTLLIKFIYPISQISTFIFEICLDNNVLIQDKSDKSKQNKQSMQNDSKKFTTFGSIIRHKIVLELQSQLLINKQFDEIFIRNHFNKGEGECLMIKKVSSMGLMTILLSIRQFAKICIQNNLLKRVQQEYLRTSSIVKNVCKSNSPGLGLSSNVVRNFLLNYFIRPMQILQELTIQYHIFKKQSAYKLNSQFSNYNRLHIRFLLTGDTINQQLFRNDIFFKSKFKTQWLYANNLEGDEAIQNQYGLDQDDHSSANGDEQSEDGYNRIFDSQSQQGPLLDQQIQDEQNLDHSIQISGQQLLHQPEGQDQAEQSNLYPQQGGSRDPFDQQSNSFQNVALYPDEDHILEDDISSDDDDEISQDDIGDGDEDQIDHYDDSQDQQDGLQIQMQPSDEHGLFQINQNSISSVQNDHHNSIISRVVPEVGIYYFFMPQQPQRRDHPNHSCQYAIKPQIRQLQNLYQIFMDVVSFEHIVITNNMVKLQNQQAKMIRKIFKLFVYKSLKGKMSIHNQHILKLEEEYFQQIFTIFSLDSMLQICEKIDFRQCQKMSYFLQCIPTHYVDFYMDEPQIYFNQITKPLRGRRRGIFLNPHMMERFRRSSDQSQYRMGNPFAAGLLNRQIARPRRDLDFQSSQSSQQIANQNPQQNPGQGQHPLAQEGEQNPDMNRIQFNIENPNGGVINFHADLSQILQNMGMSEGDFLNLSHEVQSDIIQNSLQNQLQRQEGNLHQLVGRFIPGVQAPNVSPALIPHSEEIQEEDQQHQQANLDQNQNQSEVQMPQSFDMEQQNERNSHPRIANESQMESHQEMNEQENDMQEHDQTPIHQINQQNHQENHQENQGQDQILPERYRKISMSHSQKISKDIIQILNKDNKNDSKFPQISEQLLEQIIQTVYLLENKDFSRFSYSLINMNMINSKSCLKIISSIMALLKICPNKSELSDFIQDKQHGINQILSKKLWSDLFPKTVLRTYLYEFSKNYQEDIYPIISTKLLHILYNLTKSYSISMQMLKINNSPLKILEKYVLSQSKQQSFLSSFQILIRLLDFEVIKQESTMVEYILRITNNIVTHYFQKNIFSIHQQQKQLKQSKKKLEQGSEHNAEPSNKIQNENNAPNILPVLLQQQKQVKQEQFKTEIHKAIQLSDKSIELLCSLLMSESQSQSLSELIMKLSINGKNLILFIKNIQSVLQKLCEKSILFLNKQKFDSEKKHSNIHVEETELEDLMKVFCLLQIFSSMIKQFKQFAYRHHIERYDFIMAKFKDIIQSKSLFILCETIASIISNTGQGNDLIKTVPQIFQIFFLVYGINIELTNKNGQQDKNVLEDKQANKIASLGQINEKHKTSPNIKKNQQSLIQNTEFNKLWNDKVCSQNGRLLLNSTIKRKLSTILKRKKQMNNVSLFDIPMIKIITNSSHLLDFQNKRALFRAEVKRIKRKVFSEPIYMSLDRKQVFQQSFNIIMDKKPQQLKRRIKIDFQGQEGQDAGGLTRQWYQLLSTEMFNPNYGLFRPSSTGNTYQPSSASYVNSQHLNYFKFIGRIMGKALFDGYMLDAYFTPAFYKHILKIPITYLDMEEEDYEYFNSLKWILSNSPIQDYMDLDFTYQFDNFGELKMKQLIPNGQKVRVTEENKFRYVQLICYAKMATAVQAQLQNFLAGLHEIIPHKYLKIFDAKQLQMMISGLPTIDIVDLKRNTELANYLKTDQIIIWFFEVLQSFDMSLRTSFLQFTTGTSRVPPEGFKGLNGYSGPQKFTIQKQFDIQKLPRAHTCFNTIDLPPYPTKQMLIQKLTYAITEGKQGFGIV